MRTMALAFAAIVLAGCGVGNSSGSKPQVLDLAKAQRLALQGDLGAGEWLDEYYFAHAGDTSIEEQKRWFGVAARDGNQAAMLNLAILEARQGDASNCKLAKRQLQVLSQRGGPAGHAADGWLENTGTDALCKTYWR